MEADYEKLEEEYEAEENRKEAVRRQIRGK